MFLSLFAVVLIMFLIVILMMSVGVIFSGKSIRGSCGGIAILKTGEKVLLPCEHCSPEERKACENRKELNRS